MATNSWLELPLQGSGGAGVSSLNTLTGAVTLVAGSNITITPSGSNLTIASSGGGGSGTVTSVALTTPGVLYSVSGSPITTSGTLALALISQTQNSVLAGPTSGSGNPSFRALVAADIPTLNQNTTGTAANITATSNTTLTTLSSLSLPFSQTTGTIPTNRGGTGLTTVGAANTTLVSNGTSLSYTAFPSPYIVSTIATTTVGVSGTTYLCNTSAGAFTLTLPAPASGSFVAIKDSTGSFSTNNLTIAPHASEMIEGLAGNKVLFTNWGAWSFFSDGTNWFMGPF